MKLPFPSSKAIRLAGLVIALGLSSPCVWSATKAPDLDGDGIPNIVDPDIDNDGIPNALDKNVDGGIAKSGPFKGKYVGDHLDNDNPAEKDIDGDTQADNSLSEKDIDGDGKADDDATEKDIDGDGREDGKLAEKDIDGDGRSNDGLDEDDIDGDGYDDDDPAEMDSDGDDLANGTEDDDDDGDGKANTDDDDDDGDGKDDNEDEDHHGGVGESDFDVNLTAESAAPTGASAEAQLEVKSSGAKRFKVRIEDAPTGTYELFVDGTSRGTVEVTEHNDETKGRIVFETTPDDEGELPLDFAVDGLPLLVKKDGIIFFSGIAPTAGAGGGDPETESSDLSRTAAAPANAQGELKLYIYPDSSVKFVVKVEGLAAGSYDLKVDGTLRATLTVVADTKGEVKFATNPSGGELPLTFETSGKPVTISQGGVDFLTGTGPTP